MADDKARETVTGAPATALCGVVAQPPYKAEVGDVITTLRSVGTLAFVVSEDASAELAAAGVDVAQMDPDLTPVAGSVYAFRVGDSEANDEPGPGANDRVLLSLAKRFGDTAIGILIGDAEGEGSHGLGMIGATGGLALVYATDAPYQPTRGRVTTVGSAEHLLDILHATVSAPTSSNTEPVFPGERLLGEICDAVRHVTGHDFRHYKPNTLGRRIMRRVQVRRCASAEAYLALLNDDTEEARALMRDLLIGVTAFFRDPDAYTALGRKVFSRLIKPGSIGPLRLWVAGCGGGHEAYSLTMLALERIAEVGSQQELQVFATDLNEKALSMARRGVYPASALDTLSPERVTRYFERSGGQYCAAKALRQHITFSPHNLISDPPFSRMDLVSCRNVLIYLGPLLQKKLMSVFHYALREGGYLFLGSSEAVTGHGDLFRVVDARARIAQSKNVAARRPLEPRSAAAITEAQTFSGQVRPAADRAAVTQRILLDEFVPPYLIGAEDGSVLYVSAHTARYLGRPEGPFVNQLLWLVRSDLRATVRTAWVQSQKSRQTAVQERVTTGQTGERRRTRITVKPMPDLGEGQGTYLIMFQDQGVVTTVEQRNTLADDRDRLIGELEEDLFRTREELERTVQDLEAANEELKSSNEELLSMNEELQSANEELESSKDEIAIGAEALEDANSDLTNLLQSTEIATIFLDLEGRLRNFTFVAGELYNITRSDIGRPLAHFTHRFSCLPPMPSQDALLSAQFAHEDDATLQDGRMFLRRLTAYRLADGMPSGVVMTFVDVTALKQAEEQARRSEERLTFALEAGGAVGAWDWDVANDTLYVDTTFARQFGIDARVAAKGVPLDRFVDGMHADDKVRVLALIDEALTSGEPYAAEYRVIDHEGSERWVLARGRCFHGPDGRPSRFPGVVVDISERRIAEAALRDSEARLSQTLDGVATLIGVLAPDGTMIDANASALTAAGIRKADIIGVPFALTPWWPDSEPLRAELDALIARAREGETVRADLPWKNAAGEMRWVDFQISPVRDASGAIVALLPSGTDFTERRAAETALRETMLRYETTLEFTEIGVWIWNADTDEAMWSPTTYRLFGIPAETPASAQAFFEIMHADDRGPVSQRLEAVLAHGGDYDVQVRIHRADGLRHLRSRGRMLASTDGARRMIGISYDVTERWVAEQAIRKSSERMEKIMATAQIGVAIANVDGRLSEANAAMLAMLGRSEADLPAGTISLRDHCKPASPQDGERDTAALVRSGRIGPVERMIMRADGSSVPAMMTATMLDAASGELVAFYVDMSRQKNDEAHRQLLLDELNHRVKNTLAMIQAIASQTTRHANSLEDFRNTFNGRLRAIAAAHDILLRGEQKGADLREMIARQVEPYAGSGEDRLRLEGPPLFLSAAVAHGLGLVLHELATNAIKYGALSKSEGYISVEWTWEPAASDAPLSLRWVERNGPPAREPTRRGFGSRLIEATIASTLRGSVAMKYAAAGLEAHLRLHTNDPHDT